MNQVIEPTGAPLVSKENPWPGLESYTEETSAFFFGRTEETEELINRVRRGRVTVLYGQSGLGKSSLLQAGLFPELTRENWLPVYVRLRYEKKSGQVAELVEQVCQQIAKAIESAIQAGKVVPVSSEAPQPNGSEQPARPAHLPQPGESLWNYLHRRELGLRSPSGKPIAPALIFDQFEEIFTLGRIWGDAPGRDRFLSELADCVENRDPVLRWHELGLRGGPPAPVVPVAPDRGDYRIVLSLREEYLVELLDLKRLMPSLETNHVHLRPLNGWQATDAVYNPAESLLDLRTAREIVDRVACRRRDTGKADDDADADDAANAATVAESDMQVDPALLSMICSKLNQKRQRRNEEKITLPLVNELLGSGHQPIIRGFYGECLHAVQKHDRLAVRRYIEEELLTEGGRRQPCNVDRVRRGLASAGVSDPEDAIRTLIDRRLTRAINDRGDGIDWLELTHDVLCDVIKSSRDTRQRREQLQRRRKEEEARRREELERQRQDALRKQREEEERRQAALREAQEKEREAQAQAEALRREVEGLQARRRLGRIAAALGLLAAGMAAYSWYAGKQLREIGTNASRKANEYVTRAQALEGALNNRNAPEDAAGRALWKAAIALKIDDNNADAIALASRMLMRNQWYIPLSSPLDGDGATLITAAFTPDDSQVLAVTSEGKLLAWDTESFTPAPPVDLLAGKQIAVTARQPLTAAAFNDDGSQLIICWAADPSAPPAVANLPAPPTRGVPGEVWHWAKEKRQFEHSTQRITFESAPRTIGWSTDSTRIVATTIRPGFIYIGVFRMDTPQPEQIKGPLLDQLGQLAGADISPDGRWIATTTLDGTVGLWDTETLAPAATSGPSVLEPKDGVRATRTYSIAIGQWGMYIATSGSLDPTRVWRLPEMTSALIKPPGAAGQISRTMFNPNPAYDSQLAVGATRMVMVYDVSADPKRVGEPLAVEDAMAQPIYSHNGARLITLSGGSWSVVERLRVWTAQPMKPYPDAAKLAFTGKNAPEWLPVLAQAIAGRRIALDDEDEKRQPPPTLKRLLDQNIIQPPKSREYQPLYDRFSDKSLVSPSGK